MKPTVFHALKQADEVKTLPALIALGGTLPSSSSSQINSSSSALLPAGGGGVPHRPQVKSKFGKGGKTRAALLSSKPINNDTVDLLPGILNAIKPPVTDTRVVDDKGNPPTYVGFSATNVKFDGESVDDDGSPVKRGDANNGDDQEQKGLDAEKHISEIDLNAQGFADNPDGSFDANSAVRKLKFKKDPVMDELRNYIILMDKFSLHNFIIYEGKVMRNTPEFESFHRSFMQEWGSISGLLTQLEEFMVRYDIKLAIVNGPKLYRLASLHQPLTSQSDMLDCIANLEQVMPQMEQLTAKATGALKVGLRVRAAIKIQSIIRRKLAMIRMRVILKQKRSIIKMQSVWRLVLHRMKMKAARREDRAQFQSRWEANAEKLRKWWAQDDAVAELQDSPDARSAMTDSILLSSGMMANLGKDKARLVIHIPSISLSEQFRLGLEGMQAIQNSVISCLYQLADRNVHMIYVSPFQVTNAEQVYYERFLSMMGIEVESKRLHFVVPELTHRLPQHMSLSQMLWFSAKALLKLRHYVRRYESAVIIPGAMTWAEKRIAHYLNVPMLSPEPSVAESLSIRSRAKKVFIESQMNIPIGAHDIHTPDDLMIAISRLIACNLDVKRWLIRLNSDFNGEGAAVLDTSKISVVADLRTEMDVMIAKQNVSAWFLRPTQLAARKRIMMELRQKFDTLLVLYRSDIFINFEGFMTAVKTYGAVLEAEPLELLGIVDGLMFIDPLGETHVVGGAEVVADKRRQCFGYIWPQNIAPSLSVAGALTAVAKTLYTKYKAIGFVTIRFLTFWDAYDKIPRLWATDLRFGMTPLFGNIGCVGVTCEGRTVLPKTLLSIPPEGRHFVYLPIVSHEPLTETRDDIFFKFCKMRGVAFDVQSKSGTMFHLVDAVVGGIVSVCCTGYTRRRSLEIAITTLTFIASQFGRKHFDGIRNNFDLQNILAHLKALLKRMDKLPGGSVQSSMPSIHPPS